LSDGHVLPAADRLGFAEPSALSTSSAARSGALQGPVVNSLRISRAPRAGGRRRWAHHEFTRINIELTFRNNQVEEIMNVRGVGEKSFLKIKDRLTVAAAAQK
jgi:hypothetical protein